jgi:hypothetical protein
MIAGQRNPSDRKFCGIHPEHLGGAVMKKKAKGKIDGLNELETPIRQACNLAKALLIMSSGENMPADEGEGIFGVAETLVDLLECLQETRVELWRFACDVGKGDAARPPSSNSPTTLAGVSIPESRGSRKTAPEERAVKAAADTAELTSATVADISSQRDGNQRLAKVAEAGPTFVRVRAKTEGLFHAGIRKRQRCLSDFRRSRRKLWAARAIISANRAPAVTRSAPGSV